MLFKDDNISEILRLLDGHDALSEIGRKSAAGKIIHSYVLKGLVMTLLNYLKENDRVWYVDNETDTLLSATVVCIEGNQINLKEIGSFTPLSRVLIPADTMNDVLQRMNNADRKVGEGL